MNPWYERHADEGLMVISMVIEDESGRAPSEGQLLDWATQYGMTFPVLADPDGDVMWSYAGGGSVGLPFTVLLDRGNVVDDTNYPSDRDAEALL